MLPGLRQGKKLILLSREYTLDKQNRDTEVLSGRNSLRKYIKARKHGQRDEVRKDGKAQFAVKSMYRRAVELKNGKDDGFKGEDSDHNMACHVHRGLPET